MIRSISLHTPHGALHGELSRPEKAQALVLVAQAGSHRHATAVTAALAGRGFAILSLNLLTLQEGQFPDAAHNVPQLAHRLVEALDFIHREYELEAMPVGIFATDHATPAAIRAAAQRDAQVKAIACHGGIIDLAGLQNLRFLASPLLMLNDPDDTAGQAAFHRAAQYLAVPREQHVLGPAEDPGKRVASWFALHLQ